MIRTLSISMRRKSNFSRLTGQTEKAKKQRKLGLSRFEISHHHNQGTLADWVVVAVVVVRAAVCSSSSVITRRHASVSISLFIAFFWRLVSDGRLGKRSPKFRTHADCSLSLPLNRPLSNSAFVRNIQHVEK